MHNGRHCDNTLAVLALDGWRSEAFYHFAHIFHAHALALSIIDENILYVGNRGAEFRGIHHFDVIFLSIFAEVACRASIDAITQVIGCGGEVEPVDCELLAVEVNLIFRLIVCTRNDDVGSSRHTFEDSLHALCH